MPQSNSVMIHKLQRAMNEKFNQKICINRQQWYSEDQRRPITMYSVRQAVWDEDKQRNYSVKLFKSMSEIQIVLFMRDKWYELNGWDVPQDNEQWNKIREKYKNG